MASRNLGTLTLDLVARTAGFVQGMDKAQRESAKWRKQVDKDLQAIQRGTTKALQAGAAAVAAATAATIALTRQGLALVDSQGKLARSLDTSYDSITALQMAFGDGGIDDFEGSLNRLNRRLGAAELGRGAALQTVKELNLNLSELADSTADERIAIIADRISEVATSSQQAARFAQDLGFQQAAAAQFFLQGGDAIRAYAQQVDGLGLSLSALDVVQVEAANDAMGVFGDVTNAVSQQLAVQFAPLIAQIGTDLEKAAVETGGFNDEIEKLAESSVRAAAFVVNAVDGVGVAFTTVGKTIALWFLTLARDGYEFTDKMINGPIDAINSLIDGANRISGLNIEPIGMSGWGEDVRQELETLTAAIDIAKKDIQAGLLEPLAGDKLIKYYEDAKASALAAAEAAVMLREENNKLGGRDEAPELSAKELAAQDARLEGIKKEITALERAAEVWGMSADEVKIYDLGVQGATDTQLAHAQSLLDTVAGFEEAKASQEAYLSLVQDLRTDEERLTDQLRERLAVLNAVNDATPEDYSRVAAAAFEEAPQYAGLAPEVGGAFGELNKIDSAREELDSWYSTQLEMLAQYREEQFELNAEWDQQELALHQQHQNQIEEIERARHIAQMAAGEEFFGNMADSAKTFFGENSNLYKAAFAIEKGYAVAKAALNIPQSYSDAYKAVVGIPVVGPTLAPVAGAAAAAAQVAQAAAIGSVSLGQAHEGLDYVPETGDYTLLKGERVESAKTSAKLDTTLDRVLKDSGRSGLTVNIHNAPPGTRAQERTGPTGEQILDVWLEDFNRDGRTAQAVFRRTGTGPQGR